MPTYEFKCDSCNHYFERRLSMADFKLPESEPCPKCNELTVKKIILPANFILNPQPKTGRFARPDGDWCSFLKQVKKNNPGSDFNTYN